MKPSRSLQVLAVLALVFGALTVFSGGRTLFGGAEARAAMGQVVPFVLWFNFLAGFVYLVAGIGLLRGRRWAAWTAALLALSTLTVAGAFAIHVVAGGAYEPRTVGALAIRCAFWAWVAWVALRAASAAPLLGPRPG